MIKFLVNLLTKHQRKQIVRRSREQSRRDRYKLYVDHELAELERQRKRFNE